MEAPRPSVSHRETLKRSSVQERLANRLQVQGPPHGADTRTLELLAGAVSVDVTAREVRRGLGQGNGGHVVRLEFVPVRGVV